jgi:hypothetical protein
MTGKEFLNAVANGEIDLLQGFLDVLRDTEADHCVIGGLAVNAYAEPVVSHDLDLGQTDGLGHLGGRARRREAERVVLGVGGDRRDEGAGDGESGQEAEDLGSHRRCSSSLESRRRYTVQHSCVTQ